LLHNTHCANHATAQCDHYVVERGAPRNAPHSGKWQSEQRSVTYRRHFRGGSTGDAAGESDNLSSLAAVFHTTGRRRASFDRRPAVARRTSFDDSSLSLAAPDPLSDDVPSLVEADVEPSPVVDELASSKCDGTPSYSPAASPVVEPASSTPAGETDVARSSGRPPAPGASRPHGGAWKLHTLI
jgi:hypothetical protein